MSHWSDNYIGIPYADCDCAELAARVQREVFGRDVRLPTERACNRAGKSAQIESLLDDFGEPTRAPQDGDAVLMRAGPLWHIGVFCQIGGQRWLLHTTSTSKFSARIQLRRVSDLNMAVEGFYRWK